MLLLLFFGYYLGYREGFASSSRSQSLSLPFSVGLVPLPVLEGNHEDEVLEAPAAVTGFLA